MNLILCPTDFSLTSTNAIRYACAMGQNFNSRIILVHCFESPVVYSEVPLTVIKDAGEQLKEAATKKINALISKLKKEFKSLSFEGDVVEGLAQEQIVSMAKKLTADLIVMGATGTSKLERLLMGSTTSHVIRDAHCGVLCIPLHSTFNSMKKIVFSTDLHEDNIRSAMMITQFAAKFNAEIIFLFVDDHHVLHDDADVEKMIQKIRKKVKYPALSGYISKNTKVSKGIEYFLSKMPADLLVMFTHPKHFPESLFSTSITKLMSYQTKIPLLALKHEDKPIM